MKVTENTFIRWEHKNQKQTTCVVERDGVVFTAVAKAGHGDEFRKAIGRKLSLSRAIRSFSKAERTVIWNQLREKGVSFI